MSTVLALTSVVDCLAVLALAWLVVRSRRAYELIAAEQQTTLERLRGELADLLADAERRTKGLDETLAAREVTLRELLAASGRSDRRALRTGPRTGGPTIDPAEARLLRDLELALGSAAEGR